ncbi:SAM-dependent methyltransferase [Legionella birminghamensis]|uniref:Ribosomal RNA small subunit methyltransferase J n=1 Tax=Legionella birminghamensis TaxID=28083 RepID=A0A378ICQ1_9GAMM|nr:class I SAM-dependent methyltransferase [Legionella birminghamensis]KTC71628.1 SAM-dependent methyltransferase [Legionella birminghamensis]STX32535.1 N6-adenine-specific methylase [Legionella birminghamensis]
MIENLSIACEDESLQLRANELANSLQLPLDSKAKNQLLLTENGLSLRISPFMPQQANFEYAYWQSRKNEGKKQGIVRACKPGPSVRIIDATAGWGRDAAVLASFGASVLMLERNPVIAALLQDALLRQDELSREALNLSLKQVDAISYLNQIEVDEYPDVIYIDPMHPARQKSALVKKDLQVLQQLIGTDYDAMALLQTAQKRVRSKVVVKWPQLLAPLSTPNFSIPGKTIRFDVYLP